MAVLERVRKTITRYNMLPRGGRIAVAVSGGPDSVCLLHVLVELARSFEVSLAVAHLNHQLRGAESDDDENFVAGLAASLGLPFHRAAADVAAVHDNLEQAGRRARRDFFAGLTADRIALGHTRDDQAETVLFRLLRGSGLRGLAGIYPVTAGGYIRPLIDVTRADVIEFLRARGLSWREDASNLDACFARNRIRGSLLPQLTRDWNPKIAESLAHLAHLAHDEERWWRTYIDDLASGILLPRAEGIEVRASDLTELAPAVSRRLLRHAVTLVKGDLRRLEYGHVERILELAAQPQGDGRLRLPGLDIRRSFDWIRHGARGAANRSDLDAGDRPGGLPGPGRRLPPFRDRAACLRFKKGCYAKGSRVKSAAPPPCFRIAGVETGRSLPSGGAKPGSKDQGNVPSGAGALLAKAVVADCR